MQTFVKIKSTDNLYGKDLYNVYFKNDIIPGADPQTFHHIKEGYAIDKNRAYYYKDSIANSSSKGFKIIDGYFSKDYRNVFHKNKSLDVCSVENFAFVYQDEQSYLGRWSTDGCYYYYNSFKVPSNDYKNIELFKQSGGISKDTEFIYDKDKKYILPKDRKILLVDQAIVVKDTIDIKTFTVENRIHKDKFGLIDQN